MGKLILAARQHAWASHWDAIRSETPFICAVERGMGGPIPSPRGPRRFVVRRPRNLPTPFLSPLRPHRMLYRPALL